MILTQETYVQKAEEAIDRIIKQSKSLITTSQIRNLLSLTADIYNEAITLNENTLNERIRGRITYLKIRFIYEAGRDKKMGEFVKESKIIECLDEIGNSKENYILFSRYMEALVAYHRFYGGRDL